MTARIPTSKIGLKTLTGLQLTSLNLLVKFLEVVLASLKYHSQKTFTLPASTWKKSMKWSGVLMLMETLKRLPAPLILQTCQKKPVPRTLVSSRHLGKKFLPQETLKTKVVVLMTSSVKPGTRRKTNG